MNTVFQAKRLLLQTSGAYPFVLRQKIGGVRRGRWIVVRVADAQLKMHRKVFLAHWLVTEVAHSRSSGTLINMEC